jgi:APA family basic amino acid/polyamine antiporter
MTVAPSQLMRVLRRRDLVGILLNAMIGAGMLAAPAKVYALAGDWSFLVLAAAAIILIPLVLCFADLGSRFSGTGGAYLYARAGLPPSLAFAVGWLLWLSQALSVATLANLLVTYLGGFFPALEAGWGRISVLIVLGIVLTSIVLAGIRQSAGASNLLIVIKVTFVVAFLAAGVAFVQPERLAIARPPPDLATFAQAILVYLFAYSGFERGAVVAGEARDPQHDVPLALLGSAVIVTLAYAAVMLVCVGVLAEPAATDRPLAEAGRQLYGQAGAVLVSAGAIAVIVGTILVITISMPRMLMSLAEHGQLPASLGRVHATWRTPYVAILVSSSLAFGFAIASDLISALTFATATRLLGYILCCIALWRLSRRPDAPPAMFNLPARGVVALATAALFTGVLLIGATKELPSLAGVLVIGFALMALTRRLAPPQPAP